MANTSGQAYALMVMTPVLPGQETALRDYFTALPEGEQSPLARMGTTHFARWLVLDDFVDQGVSDEPDHLSMSYLIFVANFDGERDRYLSDLATQMGSEADAIWGRCVGYPGSTDPRTFGDYLRHNQIDTTFFFSAYPHAAVPDVRACLQLRKDIADFAAAAQTMTASEMTGQFADTFLQSV